MNKINTAIEMAETFDPWLKPDLSVIDNRRKPPVFPVEILGEWQPWIEATAQSRSAPVDYVVVSLLSLLSHRI